MSALPSHPISLLGAGIFCLILAIIVIIKVLVPKWRTTWVWGRNPPQYPITILGHLGISLGLLLMSFGALGDYFNIFYLKGIGFLIFLAGFTITMIAGMIDRMLNWLRSKK